MDGYPVSSVRGTLLKMYIPAFNEKLRDGLLNIFELKPIEIIF